MQNDITGDFPREEKSVADNEKGSVIVIVIIILALLTIGGIMATNSSITESYIVRNSGIYAQNIELAEAAALEGMRDILTMTTAAQLAPGAQAWMHDHNTWDDNPADQTLNNANSVVPTAITNDDITVIKDRGETADDPLRFYFVGWTPGAKESLKSTGPTIKEGKVVGVYRSKAYGRVRIEVGVLKKF